MNHQGQILDGISGLSELFAQHCHDRSTLDELRETASVNDRRKWKGAKGLFDRIRTKSNRAYGAGESVAYAQYLFEEACAKTLYNLSNPSAPFDADSPYWVVPKALILAQRLGVPEEEVVRRVAV